MLDSLLNCSKRVIRLDRLVINDSYSDHTFLTDPDAIKQAIILHQLSNNKTLDPFQISNEMLKHLGLSIQHKLWLLVKAVLTLNDIPNQ